MWTPLDWAYIGGSYDALFPTLHHGYPMLAYRPRKFDPEDNPLRPTRFKEGLGKKGKTLMSH